MTWGKNKGHNSDGPYAQSWQVWRGSWSPAPWKQQQSQQPGHKGKNKGQGKGTGKGKTTSTFPSYDSANPVVDLVQEIPTPAADNLIGGLQKAINQARKLESQLRKLEITRQEKARQWRTWQEDLKQSYAREKMRFQKDMTKLEQDTVQTMEELSKARACLRNVATAGSADTQQEALAARVEEDFAELMADAQETAGDEANADQDNLEVLRRAMEAAAGSQMPPALAGHGLRTPARRTQAPAMTPERGEASTYTVSPGVPAATDPYMSSPMAPAMPVAATPVRHKEQQARQGVKDTAKPKQPVHAQAARASPSLAEKLEARRGLQSSSVTAEARTPAASVETNALREQEARSRLNIPAQVPVLLLDDDTMPT